MGRIVRDSSEPLYRQLESLLREDITAGHLRPGDQLPSEPDLARQHGIARMTARQAIDKLVEEGLLVRRRGRGTFVAEPRMAYPPASLISFSRTMAALGRPVTTRLLDLELVPAHGEIAKDLAIEEGEPVLLVRRLRLVDGKPVAVHASYMDKSYLNGLSAADLLKKPISEAMENVNGVRIVSSRDYLEATAATYEEAQLLQMTPGEPIQIVRGVAFTEDHRPVLATLAAYRADCFRFLVGASAGDPPFQINPSSTDAKS
jgi:GntR family transcriptional regulator